MTGFHSDPFLPAWLNPDSPQFATLDPTGMKSAGFIMAYVMLKPDQDTFTPEEIAIAERTLTYVAPFPDDIDWSKAPPH